MDKVHKTRKVAVLQLEKADLPQASRMDDFGMRSGIVARGNPIDTLGDDAPIFHDDGAEGATLAERTLSIDS